MLTPQEVVSIFCKEVAVNLIKNQKHYSGCALIKMMDRVLETDFWVIIIHRSNRNKLKKAFWEMN